MSIARVSGSSGGGTPVTVQDEGTARTQRSAINFVGAGVSATDDAANSRTVVTIPGGSGGSGTNPDNAISGLVGDNSTNNSSAFANAYTTVAGGRASWPALYSNQVGTKVVEIPAGTYVVTSPGALMSDLDIPRTMGLTIRGAGRAMTTIVFSPGTTDQYLMDNNEDWMQLTFEDLTFYSTVPTASFMKSTSDGGPQNYVFNRVNWDGTWKYGLHLIGTNVNSELTWMHCGIYGDWTAFLFSGTDGSDQFLNYNFFATQCETNTGNFIDMARGGNINVWGGSWIHIGDDDEASSSPQTFLKLRDGDHSSGVQRVYVAGVRVEHRHVNSTIIDCEWKRGMVKMESIDADSHSSLLLNPTAVVAAKFGISDDVAPIITWDSCMMMGKHRYYYDVVNGWSNRRNITYRNCEVTNFLHPEEFIDVVAQGAGGNTAGKPVISFEHCRSIEANVNGYEELFDVELNWQTAINAQPRQRTVTLRLPNGRTPYVGDPTWNVKLPRGAVVTKLRAGKPAGGTSTATTATYTLRDANNAVVGTVAPGAAWNAAWSGVSADLWFLCNTDTSRNLTLTMTGVNEGPASATVTFLIDYYS